MVKRIKNWFKNMCKATNDRLHGMFKYYKDVIYDDVCHIQRDISISGKATKIILTLGHLLCIAIVSIIVLVIVFIVYPVILMPIGFVRQIINK